MEEIENGKVFSITCDNEKQVFVYNIERLNGAKMAFERLDSVDEIMGAKRYKRLFYLKNLAPEGNDLLLVTIKDKTISISRLLIENSSIKVQKNISNITYELIKAEDDSELEFKYIEDMKKAVCVFNVTEKSEVVPTCFFDYQSNIIKGKFKLTSNQKYIILKLGKNSKEKTA